MFDSPRIWHISDMKTWGILGAALAAVAWATPALAAPPAPTGVVVARYTFDTAKTGTAITDDSGHNHVLTPSSARVKLTAKSAAFPAKCNAASKQCPRAVLQAADAPDLNPGAGPIRFGATVKLARGQTGIGENILQKGYSATGGQYKLQVDGRRGRPSCVLSDNVVRGIHLAQSDVSISDGAWHGLECRRSGTTLTLLVDGAVHATATIPATLAISNTVPLSLGGKGDGTNNDQFHGTLDDVWIAVG